MHTFQPYPIDVIEFNPFVKFGQDWAALTTQAGDKYNTMTISWGGVGVLWGKNVATVYVRDSRYTKELMDAGEFFSITFFEKHYHRSLQYLGAVSGRQEDKFKGAGLTINKHLSIPFVDEGNFVILCRKLSATKLETDQFIDPKITPDYYPDGNLHTMYVGEIMELLAR